MPVERDQVGRSQVCAVCGSPDCTQFDHTVPAFPTADSAASIRRLIMGDQDGEHVIAQDRVFHNGILRYAPGDKVPMDRARALGLAPEDVESELTTSKPKRRGGRRKQSETNQAPKRETAEKPSMRAAPPEPESHDPESEDR